MRAGSAAGPLTGTNRALYASLVQKFDGDEAALPLLDALAGDAQHGLEAEFVATSIRLVRGDPDGPKLMEQFALAHRDYAISAYQDLASFYRRSGDDEAANRARQRLVDARAWEEAEDLEFRTLSSDADFDPPRYSEDERTELQRSLAGVEGLQALLAGSRILKYRGATQQIVLCMPARGANRQQLMHEVQRLVAPYGPALTCMMCRQTRWLRHKLYRTDNAIIYPW